MSSHHNRPKFLTLWQIHFPYSALVSIAHRISGFLMSLFVPFFVWILYLSLHSEESFQFLTQKIAHDYCVRLVLWALSCAFLYHIYSGVRHLLMDLHYFESKEQGQSSALFVIGLFLVTGLSYTGWFWRIL